MDIKDDFQKHLDNNHNIVFSGKFGLGKTCFLKDFFKDSQNYKVCHLFPVNYHISSNEDIIDLLKYDIISWFDDSGIFKFNNTNNKEIVEALVNYGWKSFFQFAKSMGKSFLPVIAKILLNKIGIEEKDLKYISKGLLDGREVLKKTIDGVEKELATIKDDELQAQELKNEIARLKTNQNNNDFLSSFIYSKLYENKKNTNSENILIIDDLDRLDPEHIFRILNVISSFNDIETGINKFGFDKIIIVLDINNLRSIYQHKYGIDTDFEGYIDKFYSSDLFHFTNKKIGEEWNIKFLNSTIRYSNNRYVQMAQFITLKLSEYNLFTYRNMIEYTNKIRNSSDFSTTYNNIMDDDDSKDSLDSLINLLKVMISDPLKLINQMSKSKKANLTYYDYYFNKEIIKYFAECFCKKAIAKIEKENPIKQFNYSYILYGEIKTLKAEGAQLETKVLFEINDISDIWECILKFS